MIGSQRIYAKMFINAVCTQHYLKGYGGKRLHTCKYGFPFAIPHSKGTIVLEMFAGINQNFSNFLNNAIFKNAIVSASLKQGL